MIYGMFTVMILLSGIVIALAPLASEWGRVTLPVEIVIYGCSLYRFRH